jgi:hypothetical protein
MYAARDLPVLRPTTLLLTGLSLSIGWGIRGNFGHEYGAMIPGCLAAIALCLLSGREDWRERVPYFAAFGALGWAFGGSMSYMQVIAYTHSGHLPSQIYGFYCLFIIGFLWAAMGGAGTAFAAVADRERLTAFFKPILWVFALWLLKKWLLWPLMESWQSDYERTWNRQESPLYWFDTDWTEALTALVAVFLYDLWTRRPIGKNLGSVEGVLGARRLPLALLAGAAIVVGLYILLPMAEAGGRVVPIPSLPFTMSWMGRIWLVVALVAVLALAALWDYRRKNLEAATVVSMLLGSTMLVIVMVGVVQLHLGSAPWLWATPHLVTELSPRLATLLLLLVLTAGCVTVTYPLLTLLAGVGAVLGILVQSVVHGMPRFLYPEWQNRLVDYGLHTSGTSPFAGNFLRLFVHPQGDADRYREVHQLSDSVQSVQQNLLNNWPQFFGDMPDHIGWLLGAMAGVVIYFLLRGRFRDSSGLIAAMAGGWFLSFLLLPVLLNFGGAGLRMTPPRGDDWAGILGVFLGATFWLLRHRLGAVVYASWICGILGGLAFSGMVLLKLMMVWFGNPNLGAPPESVAVWQHWQAANWHSFLEQTYGFSNGIAICIAMAMLARRAGPTAWDRDLRRWTEVAAVAFVLFLVLYVNIYKNVAEFVRTETVPAEMYAPLLFKWGWTSLTAATWFNLVWALMAGAGIWLMARHLRRPIEMVPASWLGKGQLLFLVFLWAIVVANVERALPAFQEQRLLTEWVISVNAIIASVLVLACPRPGLRLEGDGQQRFGHDLLGVAFTGILAAALLPLLMVFAVRCAYGDQHAGHSTKIVRFGPDAEWRVNPNLKGGKHS